MVDGRRDQQLLGRRARRFGLANRRTAGEERQRWQQGKAQRRQNLAPVFLGSTARSSVCSLRNPRNADPAYPGTPGTRARKENIAVSLQILFVFALTLPLSSHSC